MLGAAGARPPGRPQTARVPAEPPLHRRRSERRKQPGTLRRPSTRCIPRERRDGAPLSERWAEQVALPKPGVLAALSRYATRQQRRDGITATQVACQSWWPSIIPVFVRSFQEALPTPIRRSRSETQCAHPGQAALTEQVSGRPQRWLPDLACWNENCSSLQDRSRLKSAARCGSG